MRLFYSARRGIKDLGGHPTEVMLFPLLQKPMLFADSHVDICFLSTPKIGYPYQIDPQLLTSNRAN